jgi:hypothetical protein
VRRKKAVAYFARFHTSSAFPSPEAAVGLLHFVARDRHGSLLTGPVPIRKRAAFNVKVKGMIDRAGHAADCCTGRRAVTSKI